MVCRGQHTISWWCKLQSNIALSSCEAELNAALKGAVEGINVQRLAASLGDELPLELRTDASAARGVILRQGVGKVRHLQLKKLWLQENVAAGELTIVQKHAPKIVLMLSHILGALTTCHFGLRWGYA